MLEQFCQFPAVDREPPANPAIVPRHLRSMVTLSEVPADLIAIAIERSLFVGARWMRRQFQKDAKREARPRPRIVIVQDADGHELRRVDGHEIEFVVQTYWESMQAIEEFAGPRPRIAVVEPAARAALSSLDAMVLRSASAFASGVKAPMWALLPPSAALDRDHPAFRSRTASDGNLTRWFFLATIRLEPGAIFTSEQMIRKRQSVIRNRHFSN